MKTALYSHPICLEHDTGLGHPERADRLRAVMDALEAEEFAYLMRLEAPKAAREQLELVHAKAYVDMVFNKIPEEGRVFLDADTLISPASGEAALRAAGAVCAAVDGVMAGDYANAFCACRPPGHHAEPARAMGFCLFNNVAIGARHAREAHGLSRVAVVDFDVHHGNGTQAAFERDAGLFYVSMHQSPLYPGTGAADERGVGNILNVPLTPLSDGQAMREAVEKHVIPALDGFRPELLMISAGFDAHDRDPLANLHWTEPDYEWITGQLLAVANRHCEGRTVSTLEGGYDLKGLADAAAAHVRTLMTG
jgi:acetoin utilization deacetylase AcuC-like enzyme